MSHSFGLPKPPPNEDTKRYRLGLDDPKVKRPNPVVRIGIVVLIFASAATGAWWVHKGNSVSPEGTPSSTVTGPSAAPDIVVDAPTQGHLEDVADRLAKLDVRGGKALVVPVMKDVLSKYTCNFTFFPYYDNPEDLKDPANRQAALIYLRTHGYDMVAFGEFQGHWRVVAGYDCIRV